MDSNARIPLCPQKELRPIYPLNPGSKPLVSFGNHYSLQLAHQQLFPSILISDFRSWGWWGVSQPLLRNELPCYLGGMAELYPHPHPLLPPRP